MYYLAANDIEIFCSNFSARFSRFNMKISNGQSAQLDRFTETECMASRRNQCICSCRIRQASLIRHTNLSNSAMTSHKGETFLVKYLQQYIFKITKKITPAPVQFLADEKSVIIDGIKQKDVPAHVTILTFLMIAFDRYLFVRNPAKARLPGFIFSTGAWLTAICIALPYPIYTTYVSLEEHVNVSHAVGAGICIFGIDKAMKEYSRGIFVGMFAIPLAVIVFIFYQIYQKLEEQDQPIVVEGNEIRLRATFRRYYSIHKFNRGILSNQNLINRPCGGQMRTENSSIADQFEVDPKEEEKRVQMFLWSIVISFTACFGPLNIVSKMIYPDLHETYETTPHLDKLFVIFCWIAFLSTIITPLLVFSMIMNDEDKNILKSYVNLCKRRSSVYDRSFELEENFANVAYISHPSATTLSTEVGAQSDRPYLKTRN